MVLADTGYWLALANVRDRRHEAAVEASRRRDFDTYRWKDTKPFHNLLET